ncbi:hypothetical protein K431DRAFT_156880 [Polychaeton citri CBS 116435]|uniref:L-gulonate 3-dehydrogenase n=1 Tax=Polychaeton citri CBS 116435 TaxID=1314669 RepID=A0A9P4UQB9_9PEZI|nr:hypothetical protein K431DRAFT_156880 [Polychaeton citri CBS 116435]
MSQHSTQKIAIIGSGTIGLSFAALHLTKNANCHMSIYDTRPDLEDYIAATLPSYLPPESADALTARLTLSSSLQDAVSNATIIQEQGPEALAFKQQIWPQIEAFAPKDALFWTSTSGIPASQQGAQMQDQSRLMVVHPFNPPHIMPLLEIVPSPQTRPEAVERTVQYWRSLGRSPVVIQKECMGFVANRLAFALLREACSLVANGVISVSDLDEAVTASMGPRWAVAGPFKSYHAGGGEGGLASFMDKIGWTIGECWKASEADVEKAGVSVGGAWQEDVCRQADEAYGVVDTRERDEKTKRVLDALGRG